MSNEELNEVSNVIIQETYLDEGVEPETATLSDTLIDVVTLRPRLRRLSSSKSFSSSYLTPLSSVASSGSICSQGPIEIRKLDRDIEKICKNEEPTSGGDMTSSRIENPYQTWECGFGYDGDGDLDQPAEVPNTKAEFVEVLKDELTTICSIQNGLVSYSEAIHSGVHHAFSKDFLKHTTDATHKTIGQLFQISRNLQNVVRELEAVRWGSVEVKAELREAYAHAKPWIQRARAILVSSHVFYKINYVLGSEKVKH